MFFLNPLLPDTAEASEPSTIKLQDEPLYVWRRIERQGATTLQPFIIRPGFQGGHERRLELKSLQDSRFATWKQLLSKKAMIGRRGCPNSSATLVKKYGKCQEVVGRGASGIVRIAHKKIENGPSEDLYSVKQFKRQPGEAKDMHNIRVAAEFYIASELRHPNVVYMLDLSRLLMGTSRT